MNEKLDMFLGHIWDICDDLDCLLQVMKDLERFYEYNCDQKCRRLVKFIGLSIGQTRDNLKETVKKEVYGQQDLTEEE